MSIITYKLYIYNCKCDECGKTKQVEGSAKIYNGAQAVRSINWAYGRDKRVLCDKCRQYNFYDKYKAQ